MIRDKFLSDLKNRTFDIPYCGRCRSPAWPPVDNCYSCMAKVKLRRIKSPIGNLIEHTTTYNDSKPARFGVIEINGIKLIGSLCFSVQPYVGMSLRMTNCGVSDEGTPFYEFGCSNCVGLGYVE